MQAVLQNENTFELEASPRPRLRRLSVVGAFVVYFILAICIGRTKAPWCDEGWIACPAYNFAFRGNLGTNVLEPTGHFLNADLKGIQSRTYTNPPAHFVLLAGWFRAFGFSIVTTRLYSVVWSAGTLLLLYSFMRRFASDAAAVITLWLTSIDFLFLWGSADGRMDAATGTLVLGGVVAYMFLRERRLGHAIVASQALCALGWLMHPIAMFGSVTVAVLAFMFDRRRIRMQHILLAIAPYVAAFGMWGIYIAQSPSEFAVQFGANVAGRNAIRLTRIMQPWKAVEDLVVLYLGAYVTGSIWTGPLRGWIGIIPLLYAAALMNAWCSRSKQVRVVRICMAAYLFVITFLIGFKGQSYTVILIPLHNALLALMLVAMWQQRKLGWKIASTAIAITFVMVQLSTCMQRVRADEQGSSYRDAMNELRRDRASGKSITAFTAAGFDLGFDGYVDDARLGFHSKRSADVILLDRSYKRWYLLYEKEEPAVFTHVAMTLTKDYVLKRRYGDFWIFERRTAPLRGDAPVPRTFDELMQAVVGRN